MSKQTIIDEVELVDELEPSEAFAGLVARVGDRAGVGTLGLGAIDGLVRKRAANGGKIDEAAPADAPKGAPAAG
jgi:hypothetical protein